jgi:hypothetical protein
MSIRCELCGFVAADYRNAIAKQVMGIHRLADHDTCCGKVQSDIEKHVRDVHFERKQLRDWVGGHTIINKAPRA